MKTDSDSERRGTSAEHIVEVATALFAEHGYHGVSTRQLAAATGLSVATVHHHIGTKRELYLTVYRGLWEAGERFFDEVVAQLTAANIEDPDIPRDLPSHLVDRFIDFVEQHPLRARLFMRHWLDGADDFEETEAELSLSLYRKVRDLLDAGQEAGIVHLDVDPGLFMRSFDWIVYGYFVSGAFDWNTWRDDPHRPEKIAEFKRFLKEYLSRMLGLRNGQAGPGAAHL